MIVTETIFRMVWFVSLFLCGFHNCSLFFTFFHSSFGFTLISIGFGRLPYEIIYHVSECVVFNSVFLIAMSMSRDVVIGLFFIGLTFLRTMSLIMISPIAMSRERCLSDNDASDFGGSSRFS